MLTLYSIFSIEITLINFDMTEEEYLKTFIDDYNFELEREKKLAEMKKEMNGNYTIQEIFTAIDTLLST